MTSPIAGEREALAARIVSAVQAEVDTWALVPKHLHGAMKRKLEKAIRTAIDSAQPVHDKRCPAALNMSDPCKCGETS